MTERHAEATLATATALNPHIGYDRGAEIVKEAAERGRPLREVAREMGVDEEILDEALDHRKLARPARLDARVRRARTRLSAVTAQAPDCPPRPRSPRRR